MRKVNAEDVVVICTRNRAHELELCLRAIFSTEFRCEVLIVDSSDHDVASQIRRLVIQFPNVTYLHSPPGLTVQRNRALNEIQANSTAIRIHFIDDDVIVTKNYFISMRNSLSEIETVGVTGLDKNLKKNKPPFYYKLFFLLPNREGNITIAAKGGLIQSQFDSNIEVEWLSGCSMSYNLNMVKGLYFDDRLSGYCLGEDLWFSVAASKRGRLIHQPDAHYFHMRSLQNRLDIDKMNRCEKSHRMLLIKENTSRFSLSAFWWSFFGESLIDFLKCIKPIISERDRYSRWKKLQSNGRLVLPLLFQKDDLICDCPKSINVAANPSSETF